MFIWIAFGTRSLYNHVHFVFSVNISMDLLLKVLHIHLATWSLERVQSKSSCVVCCIVSLDCLSTHLLKSLSSIWKNVGALLVHFLFPRKWSSRAFFFNGQRLHPLNCKIYWFISCNINVSPSNFRTQIDTNSIIKIFYYKNQSLFQIESNN